MGLSKAMLPFGNELMLQRVVRILSSVVGPLVVVAAQEQQLPQLGPEVQVARDRRQGCGPLEGLAVGLEALQEKADAAYVTACDVPLLQREFVERLFILIGDCSVAVPREGSFYHPLSAVFHLNVLPEVEQLIADGRMRTAFLFDAVATRDVSPDEWQDVDPESKSLRNLNDPKDYLAALREAGFTPPDNILEALADASGNRPSP
jgi:molybdopterin-guanine dinucleotide biosynthesis protein A